jgi:hypothetical protein
MPATTFPFSFETRLAPLAAAFGVTPRTAQVVLDEHRLVIRFGLWRLETLRANVAGTEVTGPYRFLKVAGPAHLSLADRGVTFATSTERGLCIRFLEPVSALLPTGRLAHPAATVTVTDVEALAEALAAPGG